MNKRVGLWLNDDMAVVVSITDNGESIRTFTSSMEHYVRYSKSMPGDGAPEEVRDRRFWRHVGEYYDTLIAHILDANAIQIFGPGEAKHELKKRLERVGLMDHIVSVDNTEMMTSRQVVQRVRERFPARAQFDLSS